MGYRQITPMSSPQPLVSVLTPVYNGEKYLAECIESVLAQTYANWEYIIVNNCSQDRTLEIAEHYAGQDSRIRIHNNQIFISMGANHNLALQQISAASQHIKMLHADDWLFPDCILAMVGVAEVHPSVGIVGAYGLRGDRVTWDGLPYPSTVVSGRELCRRSLLDGLYVFGSPTSLLIRSDLIRKRQVLYNEANIHLDKEICFDLLQDSDFGFIHQVLTYTRIHDEAATSFSERINTYLLGNLVILTKYGPIYLDSAEYKKCLKQHLGVYYTFLGQSLLHRKGKEFWEYHKNGLHNLGYPLSWSKLLGVLCLEMMNALCNPKMTANKLVGKIVRAVTNDARGAEHER
jgi:glycosyltransferase involved in cell wall biosynthesis